MKIEFISADLDSIEFYWFEVNDTSYGVTLDDSGNLVLLDDNEECANDKEILAALAPHVETERNTLNK